MEYKNLLFDVEDGVATITFNRPKALNAMNSETVGELFDAATRCKNDDSIKVVIMTGSGDKAFIAGADISEMANLRPQQALAFMEKGHEVYRLIETMPKPVIAAVNGFALGGGTEIAMCADFRYASENARFGQPEILIGLIPGWGGTQRLPRLIGFGRAKELIMGGDQINAQRAYEIGLVNKVFPQDTLMEETRKTARLIASKGRAALRAIKHTINRGYDVDLRNGCAMEVDAFAIAFTSPDAKEGLNALLEKRKPEFKAGL